jgi:hypothetical protein
LLGAPIALLLALLVPCAPGVSAISVRHRLSEQGHQAHEGCTLTAFGKVYFINREEGLLFTQVDHRVSSDFILGSVLWKNTPWIPINPSFFGYHSVPVSLS